MLLYQLDMYVYSISFERVDSYNEMYVIYPFFWSFNNFMTKCIILLHILDIYHTYIADFIELFAIFSTFMKAI